MEPNYAGFWAAFKGTAAWQGLMSMARYSEVIELRTVRMRVEMLDAIGGNPNRADIQESVWRLMELAGSSARDDQLHEIANLFEIHGLNNTYSIWPQDPTLTQ
jgi:hypothetical protein